MIIVLIARIVLFLFTGQDIASVLYNFAIWWCGSLNVLLLDVYTQPKMWPQSGLCGPIWGIAVMPRGSADQAARFGGVAWEMFRRCDL